MDKKTARQQVRRHGIDKANEADLLALIGVPMESVPWNNVNNVCELKRNYGWTEVRVTALLAAIEIGRRAVLQKAEETKEIRSSGDVAALMIPRLNGKKTESFYVIALNVRNQILGIREIARGGIDECSVDMRCILRELLQLDAASCIIIHNHPSGDSKPSTHDRLMTIRAAAGCQAVGYKLLDHVIIGHGNWYSYKDEGDIL